MGWRRWGGWEPREFHVPQPDGSTVVTREAEFDATDRAWFVALAHAEGRECGECGSDMVETTDPDNEWAYEVHDPARCYRCTSISAKYKTGEYEKNDHPQALRFPVTFHDPERPPLDLTGEGVGGHDDTFGP